MARAMRLNRCVLIGTPQALQRFFAAQGAAALELNGCRLVLGSARAVEAAARIAAGQRRARIIASKK